MAWPAACYFGLSAATMPRSLASMNMNLLLALDALLAECNVTRAASHIGLSQSAMSHNLANLRTLFADPLLVRGQDGMQKTPLARELCGPLRRTLRDLQRVIGESPQFEPSTSTREFRVASGDFTAARVGPDLIAQLARSAPGVRLAMRTVDLATLDAALERGEVDLALAPRVGDSTNTCALALAEDPFVCAVAGDHPIGDNELTVDRYVELGHVLVSPAGRGVAIVDEALARMGRARNVVCKVSSFLVGPVVVASSQLVLTAPLSSIEPLRAPLALRVLPVPLELDSLQLMLLWHRREELDPGHRWFRDLVHACYGTLR